MESDQVREVGVMCKYTAWPLASIRLCLLGIHQPCDLGLNGSFLICHQES